MDATYSFRTYSARHLPLWVLRTDQETMHTGVICYGQRPQCTGGCLPKALQASFRQQGRLISTKDKYRDRGECGRDTCNGVSQKLSKRLGDLCYDFRPFLDFSDSSPMAKSQVLWLGTTMHWGLPTKGSSGLIQTVMFSDLFLTFGDPGPLGHLGLPSHV